MYTVKLSELKYYVLPLTQEHEIFYNTYLSKTKVINRGESFGHTLDPIKSVYMFHMSNNYIAGDTNCNIIDRYNMVFPIQSVNSFTFTPQFTKIMESKGQLNRNGIYILEEYKLAYDGKLTVNEISNYITKHDDILRQYPDIKEELVNRLMGEVGERSNKNGILRATPSDPLYVRLLTFIPEDLIRDHRTVYLQSMDLAFVYGQMDRSDKHPFYIPPTNMDVNMFQCINTNYSINTSPDDDNVYCIYVGNRIEKITKTSNPLQAPGCYIQTFTNGVASGSEVVPLDKLMEHGIYSSVESARRKVDPETYLKHREIDYNLKKLEVSDKANTVDAYKIQQQFEETKFKSNKLKIDLAKELMDFEAKRVELVHKQVMRVLEIKMEMVKFKVDMLKASKVDRKSKIELIQDVLKTGGLLAKFI